MRKSTTTAARGAAAATGAREEDRTRPRRKNKAGGGGWRWCLPGGLLRGGGGAAAAARAAASLALLWLAASYLAASYLLWNEAPPAASAAPGGAPGAAAGGARDVPAGGRRRRPPLRRPEAPRGNASAAAALQPPRARPPAQRLPEAIAFPLDLAGACPPGSPGAMLGLAEERRACVGGRLPPFAHRPPNFLPGSGDEDRFLLQRENVLALEPGWVDWSWETCVAVRPNATAVFASVVGLDSWSFQHFHDNALGKAYQARQAMDMVRAAAGPACRLREVLQWEPPRSPVVAEEWDLLGFAPATKVSGGSHESQEAAASGVAVDLSRFPQDFDQVRVHPVHVRWLRDLLLPEGARRAVDKRKVVWISRQGSNSGGTGRQCANEADVLDYLRNRTANLVVFRPGEQRDVASSVRPLVELLGDACAIVGLHGGQLYNQYFAHERTAVVELVALDGRGLFHSQESGDRVPPHAHRAIWHNANVLGQPYWRLHFVSDRGTDFVVREGTMESIVRILSLAGCETAAAAA